MVGVRVRPADVAVLVLAIAFGTLPWPLLVRPAAAKDGPTPTPVPNGEIHHYHLDHLGSPQMVTDGAGTPIRWMRYTPYGEVTRWGGASTTAFTEQDGREFTGYDTEPASGLQYAGARFYDPTLALFLSHDPKREFASPYTYTNWDPVNATDPTGAEISLLTLALIGFFVGFAANAIQAGVNGASIGDAFRAGAIGGAIGFVSAPLGAFVLSEGIAPLLQHLTSLSLQQAREAAGTALLVGSLGQAGYGISQGDYTGAIGLGLSAGIGLALAQGAREAGGAAQKGGGGSGTDRLDQQLCGASRCDPNSRYDITDNPLVRGLRSRFEATYGETGQGTILLVPGREINDYRGYFQSRGREFLIRIRNTLTGRLDFIQTLGHELSHAAQLQAFGPLAYVLAYDESVRYLNRPLEFGAEHIGRQFATSLTGIYAPETNPYRLLSK